MDRLVSGIAGTMALAGIVILHPESCILHPPSIPMPKILYITKPRQIELRDEEPRPLKPHEARARMLYSGLSHGTTMNVYRGLNAKSFPCRSGYSAVGEIIETGSEFQGASVGTVVCSHSSHGTEFILSNKQMFHRVPDGLEPRYGIFLPLAGVAYNGVLESRIALGETAVIFGLGVVGLCACFQIRKAGAFRVIGIDPIARRRDAALRMGVDAVIDPADGEVFEQVQSVNDGERADVVIEASGAIPALNDAIKTVKGQSVIVALSWYSSDAAGLNLREDFHLRRIHLRVAQSNSIPADLTPRWTHERKVRCARQLLPEMPLDSLITHEFAFEDAAQAYELVDRHPDDCIQVILNYG